MRLRFLLSMVLMLPWSCLALTNQVALTPPMGWNDWNNFHCGIDEADVTNTINIVSANGMEAAGYQFIDIDDGWAGSRDGNGVIQAYSIPGKFPDGIPFLVNYAHSKGLKLGIYTDHGTNTCSSCITGENPPKDPGSYGYEYLDAFTYGQWNVDYLKEDNCNVPTTANADVDYGKMSAGLMLSGRRIVFCLCGGAGTTGGKGYQSWSPVLGNYWRTTGDISDSYSSIISHLDANSTTAYAAGPGRWNDPDMLEVGNGGMTATQDQTHFTMWCIMAAPLIMGNNMSGLTIAALQTLTNAEAIAVDQDPAGEEGVKVVNNPSPIGTNEVWSKTLGYDFSTKAVVLLNRWGPATNVTVNWTNIGLQAGTATVRDLWAHQNLGTFTNSFTANVASNTAVLLKIVGTPPVLPGMGTNYLTELQPVYAYTGYGTIVKDKSIGGGTITLNGTLYPKGIGINAFAGSDYDLGGVCSRFQATIGVDDEVGANGSVIFQVFADGQQIYNSGVMVGGSTAQHINLDVTGVHRLILGVGDADDNINYDHGDWADALVTVINTTPQPPESPSGLTAAPGNAITLAWNPTLAAISYNVKRSSSSAGPFVTVTNVPLAAFTDTNVIAGTPYYYEVSALSITGEGSNSPAASAEPCSVPAPPTNVVTTVTAAVAGSSVLLTWKASAGATSYNISRFTSGTPPVYLANVATTNFTDTNVVLNSTNFYFVSAGNACNESGNSSYAPAIIQIVNTSPAPVWNGASTTTSNWSDSANWNGVSVIPGNTLIFDGSNQTDNQNDTTAGTTYDGIVFDSTAGAFILNGNPVGLNGAITNSSPNLQIINLGIDFSNNVTFSGTSNTLIIAGGLTNTLNGAGYATVSLNGTGMLNNMFNSVYGNPGGTNILALNDSAGNWSLADNAASAPMTVPWAFSINEGTFNYGSVSSSPQLTTTTPNNVPTDNQVGTVASSTGTFNMIAGTLTTSARLNTATALNATGILNQTGGILNLGSQFQGANGGNAGEVSIVNLSAGTMNIAWGGGPFYVASRGSGSLTVSGSGTLNCSTIDVSRNAAGNAFGSVGVVHLDGGVIAASKVGTATSASQTSTAFNPAATFVFNGGTLRMNSSTAPFFQGSTVAPIIPISAIVQAGGAVIDSNGHTNIFAERLLHDPNLGAASDGGLAKNGSGCLILLSNLTYTGSTLVNAGTLALSNAVALISSSQIKVAVGAVIDASGRSDGTLTLANGQNLSGNGAVNGNAVIAAGAVLAPGGPLGPLAFNENLTFAGSSTTLMQLSKSPLTNSSVQVSGLVSYGGTLVLTNISGLPLANGDSFTLFRAGNYADAFNHIIPAIPGLNLAWNTNDLASNGSVSVVSSSTPPPVFTALTSGAGRLFVNGTNGVPNWTYYVLCSSNLFSPLPGWTRIATNSFGSNGSFGFTNQVTAGAAANFYMIQLAP